jgi:transposase
VRFKKKDMRKVHKNAAGADVGSREIYIATHKGEVKSFQTFTQDLKSAVQFMVDEGVSTVAMEATGVYWINLYSFAQQAGLDVYVVNPYDSRNLPGRKTDVKDCQWIQKLHTHGLLRKCFVPDKLIQQLRHFMRLREDHIQMASAHINHIQKALTEMNIQLTGLLSQVHGKSGMAIINAIIEGQRDPDHLLSLCDEQVKRKKGAAILKALEGNYLPHYIFGLKQARDLYLVYNEKMAECDKEIERLMRSMHPGQRFNEKKSITKPVRHHAPKISNLHDHIMLLCNGNDATLIPGLTDYSLLKLIAEVGTDMSIWPSAKHFTSWLGLAPKQHQSGQLRKSSRHRPNNRAGQVFRTCAQSLLISKKNALGAFGRRIRSRKGPFVAIKALARKLAEMYYRVLTKGWDYVEQGIEAYNLQYTQKRKQLLLKSKQKLDLELSLLQALT